MKLKVQISIETCLDIPGPFKDLTEEKNKPLSLQRILKNIEESQKWYFFIIIVCLANLQSASSPALPCCQEHWRLLRQGLSSDQIWAKFLTPSFWLQEEIWILTQVNTHTQIIWLLDFLLHSFTFILESPCPWSLSFPNWKLHDQVKQAGRAAKWKSGPGGPPRLLVIYISYLGTIKHCNNLQWKRNKGDVVNTPQNLGKMTFRTHFCIFAFWPSSHKKCCLWLFVLFCTFLFYLDFRDDLSNSFPPTIKKGW